VFHSPAGPDLLHLGVQPQVRVGALQRPLPKGLDLLVQTLQSRDTWSLLIPASPRASTSRSTLRVEIPFT
jgi:hypothetical protein